MIDELVTEWLKIGAKNPWVRESEDPPFAKGSFYKCATLDELEEKLAHGNWSLGQAFYYQDLCFINQVNGGDEWLTIRHGFPFESITFEQIIIDGRFRPLIERLLNATPEQCRTLQY